MKIFNFQKKTCTSRKALSNIVWGGLADQSGCSAAQSQALEDRAGCNAFHSGAFK